MSKDSRQRIIELLSEASTLVGRGRVRLQVINQPVAEWVYIGLENGRLVVDDDGKTFWAIVQNDAADFLPWSAERARVPAATFGVDVLDESMELPPIDGEPGSAEAFRLAREVKAGEDVADVVYAVARAIDGVEAVHTRRDSSSYGSSFWDSDRREEARLDPSADWHD